MAHRVVRVVMKTRSCWHGAALHCVQCCKCSAAFNPERLCAYWSLV